MFRGPVSALAGDVGRRVHRNCSQSRQVNHGWSPAPSCPGHQDRIGRRNGIGISFLRQFDQRVRDYCELSRSDRERDSYAGAVTLLLALVRTSASSLALESILRTRLGPDPTRPEPVVPCYFPVQNGPLFGIRKELNSHLPSPQKLQESKLGRRPSCRVLRRPRQRRPWKTRSSTSQSECGRSW